MLYISCIKVRDKFSRDYVEKLKAMVKKNLSVTHTFICYTDNPVMIYDELIQDVPEKYNGWWAKGTLFTERVEKPTLYFDLDVVIVDSINDLIRDKPTILNQKYKLSPKKGKVVKYQSSVMYLPEGKYESPTERDMDYYRGDQDWIGDTYSWDTYPDEWWETMKYCENSLPKGCKIVLGNSIKNHEAVKKFKWVNELWTL